MNLIRNIALSLMLLSTVEASVEESVEESEIVCPKAVRAVICPTHGADFIEAKNKYSENFAKYVGYKTLENNKDRDDALNFVLEAVTSLEAIAENSDHPDFFYAAVLLYNHGIDADIHKFEKIPATNYKPLALEVSEKVLCIQGHKDFQAAFFVRAMLKMSCYFRYYFKYEEIHRPKFPDPTDIEVRAASLCDRQLDATPENFADGLNAFNSLCETVTFFERFAKQSAHPDSFYAAMILYRLNACEYKDLAIEAYTSVLNVPDHKYTDAAISLKRKIRLEKLKIFVKNPKGYSLSMLESASIYMVAYLHKLNSLFYD